MIQNRWLEFRDDLIEYKWELYLKLISEFETNGLYLIGKIDKIEWL